jgi:hypothetical protein
MPRELDTMMAAGLPGSISPAFLAMLTFQSGVEYVWTGIGDLDWNGHTWKGVGNLANVGAITEGVAVQAEGTSVSLAGIGFSDIPWPGPLATPPAPPVTVPAGQSVAWSFASKWSAPSSGSGAGGWSFSTSATAATGTLANDQTNFEANCLAGWWDFPLPLEIPAGAIITGIYPVAIVAAGPAPPSTVYVRVGAAGGVLDAGWGETGTTFLGPELTTLTGATVQASIFNQSTGTVGLDVTFVGMAVYYVGSPTTNASMVYEALNDIRTGGPAKIWFGLMQGGAFLGTPYQVFSGMVDKPTVNTGPDASTIALALENRLVNLQRPNNRKYTTADQHLYYPDDMGFNWVEILQELSLIEGA